jgi:hypothetical protein
MNETDRVLNVLIHDVRTPLGVAQGYLRLMKEQHLHTPDDVHRALGKTMDAIARIARLCEDAEAFLTNEDSTRTSIAVDVLAARVEVQAREAGLSLTRTGVDPGASVSVRPDLDRLAEAVLIVLTNAATPTAAYTALTSAGHSDRALTFMAAPVDQSLSPADLDVPFDPWRGPGLALARACRTIAEAGGRIVTARGPHRAVAIAFPLERRLP